MAADTKIVHWREVLDDIASGLKAHGSDRLCNLEVELTNGDGEVVLVTDVPTVLDYLANDTYWGEDGSWEDALVAQVRST